MKGKKLLSLLLILSLTMSLGLVGCGKGKGKNDQATTAVAEKDGKPKMDKEQHLNLFGVEPNTLDPGIASIETAWIAQAPIYESLTRVEVDEKGNHRIEPGVAKTWESNEKGDVYTFHLRKDAKWSDGTPVTAKDFEYSVKRVIDPKTGSKYNAFFNPFLKNAEDASKGKKSLDEVGVKAVDDYTLRFDLTLPIPYFMQLSYFPTLKPVKKEAVEKYGDKYGSEAAQIVGNGPFVIKEWTHNGSLVFEKNQNYWDKDHVYLEKMTWKIIQDVNSSMNTLFAGEADRGAVTQKEWKDKFDATGDYNFLTIKDASCEYLLLNQKDKYLKNVKIRRAFSVALNREEYSKALDNSTTVVANEYVPETISVGADPFTKKSGEPKYVKKLIDDNKDPKAVLIEGLKEEGLDPDPAKMNITIDLRGTTDYAKRQADWFIEQYKKTLGVIVKTNMQTSSIFYDKVDKGEFQIGSGGWVGDYNDPSTFIDLFHSQNGYYKTTGVNVKELDDIIEKCNATINNEERAKLFKRAEEIIVYENCTIIPITHAQSSTYQRKYVKGIQTPIFGKFDYKGVYTEGRK